MYPYTLAFRLPLLVSHHMWLEGGKPKQVLNCDQTSSPTHLKKMANHHIPNINTLCNSRLNGPGRGRGLAGSSIGAVSYQDKAAKDKVIQQTDQDASVSRLSAVEVGYLDDSFAAIFAPSQSQRRFPIINRGN